MGTGMSATLAAASTRLAQIQSTAFSSASATKIVLIAPAAAMGSALRIRCARGTKPLAITAIQTVNASRAIARIIDVTYRSYQIGKIKLLTGF